MQQLTPVTSSLLVAVGFDESTNEMIIEFPRGARYAYSGEKARHHYDQLVSPETESVGKYFLANIKNNPELPYRKLDPNPDVPQPATAKERKQAATHGLDAKKVDVEPNMELKPPEELKQLF